MSNINDKPTTDVPAGEDVGKHSVSNKGVDAKGTSIRTESDDVDEYIKEVGHTPSDIALVVYHKFREKPIVSIGGMIAFLIFTIGIISGNAFSCKKIGYLLLNILLIYIIIGVLFLIQVKIIPLFKKK